MLKESSDKTIPGGLTRRSDGTWQNAAGEPVRGRAAPDAGIPDAEIPDAGAPDVQATDAARTLAAEAGVDLSRVRGTGSGGNITKADVESHIEDLTSDEIREE